MSVWHLISSRNCYGEKMEAWRNHDSGARKAQSQKETLGLASDYPSTELFPIMHCTAALGTHRCTAGVREARPAKLAEIVLISICFRAVEPSALHWNM